MYTKQSGGLALIIIIMAYKDLELSSPRQPTGKNLVGFFFFCLPGKTKNMLHLCMRKKIKYPQLPAALLPATTYRNGEEKPT